MANYFYSYERSFKSNFYQGIAESKLLIYLFNFYLKSELVEEKSKPWASIFLEKFIKFLYFDRFSS